MWIIKIAYMKNTDKNKLTKFTLYERQGPYYLTSMSLTMAPFYNFIIYDDNGIYYTIKNCRDVFKRKDTILDTLLKSDNNLFTHQLFNHRLVMNVIGTKKDLFIYYINQQ